MNFHKSPDIILLIILSASVLLSRISQAQWSVNLEEAQKVFIENKGQYEQLPGIPSKHKIKFSARLNGVDIFFTSGGIIYKYTEIIIEPEDPGDPHELNKTAGVKDPDKKKRQIKYHYLTMNLEGGLSDAAITGKEKVPQYFTFSDLRDTTGKTTVRASGYREIEYKNIYQGIDIIYSFPAGKPGIKYAIKVHPGSDYSVIKMNYENAINVVSDMNGNINITSSFGNFTDHAPVALHPGGMKINSSFHVGNNTVSFKIDRNDNKNELLIDPWVTIPTFSGMNRAYDIDWDYTGNVYIYGGEYPFQLIKLDNSGAIQWTFSGNVFYSSDPYYGDFALDRNSGAAFLGEGWHGGSAANMLKVNSSGTVDVLWPGDPQIYEIWRVAFNSCTNQGVIGIGSNVNEYTAATFNPGLSLVNPVNFLGSWPTFVDVCLMAIDDSSGFFVMAENGSTWFENSLIKCPLGTLSPTAYMVNSGHHFTEVQSVYYYPPGSGYLYPNGFNGLAKGKYLYSYDGAVVKKWNADNGSFITGIVVSTDSFACGGIAVDNCDNIYVGTINGVRQYDSSLIFITSVTTTGAVYDVAVGFGGEIIASGDGFVAALSLFSLCSSSTSFSLVSDSTAATCAGNDGTATVTVSGGTPPYSYLWLPGSQTASVATGLAPGTYIVRVMDGSAINCNNNGFELDTVIVPAVSGFTAQAHSTSNLSCASSSDGSASISVSGGTSPYTYQWSGAASGQTTSNVTGLAAGTYYVTVWDASGCRTIDSMAISPASGAMAISANVQNIPCNTLYGYGSIDITVTGGVFPITYSWSSGETSQDIYNISTPDTYSVSVTDGSGCLVVQNYIIIQPPIWYISSWTVTGDCFDSSGTLSVNLEQNGSYNISSFLTDPTFTIYIPGDTLFTGLNPGDYIFYIQDDMSCKDTSFTFSIDSFTLQAGIYGNSPLCDGDDNGSVWVSSIGGPPPYTFSWNGGGSDSVITMVGSGTYNVTITDGTGCTGVKTYSLTEPLPLSDSIAVTNTSCGLNEGIIDITVSGGTGSITYMWSNGAADSIVTGLASGTYYITVTDNNGCTINDSARIIGVGTPAISLFQIKQVSCHGGNDGSIDINTSGGALPYTYSWSNGGSIEDISALDTGIYAVTITEGTGCINSDTFIITQPARQLLSTASLPSSCDSSDGSAWVVVSGGTPPYYYYWITGSTDDTITGISGGDYIVMVVDSNNCTGTDTATVNSTGGPAVDFTEVRNVSCHGGNDGSLTVTVTGGTLPYSISWNTGNSGLTDSALATGNYSVTVTDAKGCSISTSEVITEPDSLLISVFSFPAGCTGGGSAAISVTGGIMPYSYLWSNGSTLSSDGALNTGTYTVTVTDANGCTTGNIVDVGLSGSITAGISGSGGVCPGASVQLSATGGGSYLWNTGETVENITVTPVSTAGYSVIATLGYCSDTAYYIVEVFPAVSAFAGNDTSIYIGDFVQLNATFSGGTAPFNYSWNPGGTNNLVAEVSPRETTRYYFSIADANGCTAADTILITVLPCDAEVFIPNAFAPGCRCPDEQLFVFSDCIETMAFRIFDRWGEKVFETENQETGWDGTFNGKMMDAGVYVYYLKYTTINEPDKKIVLEGNVNLIR
ncbi:MAG: gliding motility-associated C-terminal domain-containing protein [Bacteroidetes bacterium]|nr:gliding motility-associated C-terminal domain-containing protein [Bacteroidota bacterium]